MTPTRGDVKGETNGQVSVVQCGVTYSGDIRCSPPTVTCTQAHREATHGNHRSCTSPRVRAERAGRFSFPALSPGHPGQSSLGPSLWRSSCQHLNASGPCPAQAQPLQDPYLSLLTADLTQPQGPLLARGGGGLDPAFGADFLQERGHIRVNILAASSWTMGPGQCGPQGMLWHLLRGQFALS